MLSFAVSPCSNPEFTLVEALSAYGRLGYAKFEAFTSWCKSAVTPEEDADNYLGVADRYGFEFSSIHLPPFDADQEASVARALKTAQLGADLGCRVALVKPTDRRRDIPACRALLDAIDGMCIIPVLQNHAGSAISTLEDYREVFEALDDDRMKYTLEVGQFHSVGTLWPEGYKELAGRFELVHIKDQVGKQSVPFGTGEIDLPGLLQRLAADGYAGDIVIEMEVEDRENTLEYLGAALKYVEQHTPS